MSRDPLVHFPAFRYHEESRKEANNAMMALLVGAQFSAQFLEHSSGSSHRLSEIFPNIPNIRRFDLRPGAAQDVLRGAEQHLGAMAMPQALAIHEAFILDCLKLLGVGGWTRAWEMHDRLAIRTNGAFDLELLCRFHVLREMRNSIIHRGGVADQKLVDTIANLTSTSVVTWRTRAGRSPVNIQVGDRITLQLGELVKALATTKALAREANGLLITAVPASTWAEIIVDDHLQQTPGRLDPSTRRKAVFGLRRFYYSAATVHGVPWSSSPIPIRRSTVGIKLIRPDCSTCGTRSAAEPP